MRLYLRLFQVLSEKSMANKTNFVPFPPKCDDPAYCSIFFLRIIKLWAGRSGAEVS